MEYSNQMPWTNTQVRNGPFPLERYSVFSSLSDAQNYAISSAVAYPGQIVTVVNSALSTVTAYKLETNGEICAVAPSISIDVDDLPLSAGTGIEITPDGYINTKLDGGLSANAQNEIGVNAGNGLSVVNGAVEVNILNIYGGSATAVNTAIDNSL